MIDALELLRRFANWRLPAPLVMAVIIGLSALLLGQQAKLASRAHEVRAAQAAATSLQGRLDAAKASLGACQDNRQTLQAQLADQSAQIAHAAQVAAASLAQAGAQVAVALRGKAAAEQVAGRLAALRGDSCDDYRAAEAAIKETLR